MVSEHGWFVQLNISQIWRDNYFWQENCEVKNVNKSLSVEIDRSNIDDEGWAVLVIEIKQFRSWTGP